MNYQLTPKRRIALIVLAVLVIVYILMQTGVIFGEDEVPLPPVTTTETPAVPLP